MVLIQVRLVFVHVLAFISALNCSHLFMLSNTYIAQKIAYVKIFKSAVILSCSVSHWSSLWTLRAWYILHPFWISNFFCSTVVHIYPNILLSLHAGVYKGRRPKVHESNKINHTGNLYYNRETVNCLYSVQLLATLFYWCQLIIDLLYWSLQLHRLSEW